MTAAAHVVILAAGRGSRLASLGDDTSKWLLEVGGRTLADRHLDGLEAAAGHVASVTVVTGHGAEGVRGHLARRAGGPAVEALHNPQFASRNNWWSVLVALRALPDDDAPVIVINADLLVEPAWVAAFVAEAVGGDAGGLLAVDLERELTDEAMKVRLREDRTLDRIGKVGIDVGAGEYVGMLSARGAVRRALRDALEAFVGRPDAADEWYEGAVGRTAAEGAAWHVWPMPGGGWVEIDDDADLAQASDLVAS